MRCVPETQKRAVTVNVCHYEQKTETVQVPVTTTHMEERAQKVLQTVCVPQTQKYTVQVAVPKTTTEQYTMPVTTMQSHVEKYTVSVTTLQPKTEAYTVKVTRYESHEQKRKVQVTSYKTVAEEVTETVPVTTCVAGAAGPATVSGYGCEASCGSGCCDVGCDCGGRRHHRRCR
jgi:hypothetical protein